MPSKTQSAMKAMSSKGNKRVLMRFLYAEVSKERLIQGWIAGFERMSKDRRVLLQARINQFNRFFQDMKKGDSVIYDFLDNCTTVVTINAKIVGSIEGVDFQQALLAIWLGNNPADSDLKAMMLGGTK
ncbi:MAG: chalcone isomerase family protein [Ghiorsea sp.]|nr:chalcone isomerase family protein [Ghiorsea sp.]